MKTRNFLLIGVLILSLRFNVYSVSNAFEEVSPCDDSKRYDTEIAGGGMEIIPADYKSIVQGYRDTHKDDKDSYKTTGFLLSKKACDEIFKNATANALTFDLFVQNDQLNMVVKGTHTNKSMIKLSTGSNEFVLQSFCPTDCSAW